LLAGLTLIESALLGSVRLQQLLIERSLFVPSLLALQSIQPFMEHNIAVEFRVNAVLLILIRFVMQRMPGACCLVFVVFSTLFFCSFFFPPFFTELHSSKHQNVQVLAEQVLVDLLGLLPDISVVDLPFDRKFLVVNRLMSVLVRGYFHNTHHQFLVCLANAACDMTLPLHFREFLVKQMEVLRAHEIEITSDITREAPIENSRLIVEHNLAPWNKTLMVLRHRGEKEPQVSRRAQRSPRGATQQ
jgi:hypothetical protein